MNEIDKINTSDKGFEVSKNPQESGANLQETRKNLEKILQDKNIDPQIEEAVRKQLAEMDSNQIQPAAEKPTEINSATEEADVSQLLHALQESQPLNEKTKSSGGAHDLSKLLGMPDNSQN